MSSPAPANRPQTSQHGGRSSQPPDEDPQPDVVLDWWNRFSRFGWDILGLFLLAIALLTALGLSGLTQGALITPWVSLLKFGFGWGSAFIVLVLVILSVVCFRQHFSAWPKIALSRILALEGVAFLILILLSIFGGISLERAEAGMDGGVIGWSLAMLLDQVLAVPFSTITVLIFALFMTFYGLGILQWALLGLVHWLDELSRTKPAVRQPEASRQVQTDDEDQPQVSGQPQVTGQPALPFERDPRLPPLSALNRGANGNSG